MYSSSFIGIEVKTHSSLSFNSLKHLLINDKSIFSEINFFSNKENVFCALSKRDCNAFEFSDS